MVDEIKKKEPYRYGVATEPKGITAIKTAARGLVDFASPKVNTESATVGLPDTTTPLSEAKKKYNEVLAGNIKPTVPPTEEYVPTTGGTNKPFGYPEEGKVYTNEDLNQPITGGGFGYVPKGLPEAKVSLEDYYKETITKMQDRGDKLALQIEAGFAKGKRLTAAAEELRSIQSTIPLLMEGLTKAGVGVRAEEATIGKTEAEKAKLEKEAAGLPSTFAETKELAGAKVKGMEEITYTEYIKGKNKILTNPAYLTEEDRQAALDNYEAQYPQFKPAGMGLTNNTSEEKVLPDGSKWRRTATGWQRWRE